MPLQEAINLRIKPTVASGRKAELKKETNSARKKHLVSTIKNRLVFFMFQKREKSCVKSLTWLSPIGFSL